MNDFDISQTASNIKGLIDSTNAALRELTENKVREDPLQALQALPLEVAEFPNAAHICKCLERIITDFMAALKPDEEVGIQLASFGVSHQIIVDSIRAFGPNLLVFQGQEQGLPATLVQNVSQLNFLLVAVPLAQPAAEPRRRIGFFAE